jgi:signal transduction histidine kinase
MRENHPTAMSGKGHPPYEEEFRVVGEILERDATAIMERWFVRAGEEQLHAAEHQREDAMNELLGMLRTLARRIRAQSGAALKGATELAHHHGLQRSELGWNVVELVRDYEILHGVVLEHLGNTLGELLSYRQAMVIATVMDVAVGQAVESYNREVQQKLKDQVKRQRAELRQLALDLTDAEHQERQRIAVTLHDDLQQILFAMKLHLHNASKKTSIAPTELESVVDLAEQAIHSARDLASDLYPVVLEEKGLASAVDSLAQTFQQRYGLVVTVESQVSDETLPVSVSLQRLIFRSIRELLFNVVKHARTDQAWVRIRCDTESTVRIEVEDRGVGSTMTSPPDAHGSKSLGLASVGHRVEQVGGTMDIRSEPGHGTRIVLTVPAELA